LIEDNSQIEKVCFTGGEPLIDEYHVENIYNIIKDYPNLKWTITSNMCYKMTDDILKLLLLKQVSVWTSFDIHIRFGSIRNLLTWVHNVKLLNSLRDDVRLNCCITKYLVHKDPKKMQDFFLHLGFNEYTFVQLFYVGSAIDNRKEIEPTKEEVHDWFNKVLNLGDVEHNKLFDCIMDKSTIKCRYFNETTPVDLDGKIVNCICDEYKDDKCRIASSCLSCKNYSECGGRCPLIPCIYYDKEQYDRAKEYSIKHYLSKIRSDTND
jgi:hypothetical protein